MSLAEARRIIDEGPISLGMARVVLLGFMLNLVDGFDVVAMSVSAPALAAARSLDQGALGALFSIALIGMTIGLASNEFIKQTQQCFRGDLA